MEGHLMPDHVHILLFIPPKYAVSEVVGYIKGKSAIHLARTYGEHKQNFAGQHFWARRCSLIKLCHEAAWLMDETPLCRLVLSARLRQVLVSLPRGTKQNAASYTIWR